MKKLLRILLYTVISLPALSQTMLILPGTDLTTKGNIPIAFENSDLINNGNADFSLSRLTITGDQSNVNIGGKGGLTVNQLTINKKSGKVSLSKSVRVTKEVIFEKGNLNLNGFNLVLSSTGTITGESNGKGIIGATGGEVILTTSLNAPSSVNPGNLGFVITSASNLGTVTIARGHEIQANGGLGESIKRYYTIVPTKNTGLNASVRFNYFDKELNALNENNLQLFQSKDSGATWINKGFTQKDAEANYVELTGINSLARFTLSTPGFLQDGTITSNTNVYQHEFIATIQLKPNPVNDFAVVIINSPNITNSMLTVVSANGKIISRHAVKIAKGFNTIPITMSNAASGFYNISVDLNDGKSHRIPFIKQ